jgi:two-component system, CitB family, sensor kinase
VRLRSAAESLAANDTVRTGIANPAWQGSLEAAAETTRSVSRSTFVLLTDREGVLLTGRDKGGKAALGESDALTGKGWLGVVEVDPPALVAHAPVLDAANGRVLGLVIVGKTYPPWWDLLGSATPDLLTYLLLGSSLGVAGSLLLARRVKRQTLGLEPREIVGLVEHREAMLHGIKEGLIGVDTAQRVTLANDEAIRLLGLPRNPVGATLRDLGLDALTGQSKVEDEVVLHDSRVLVLNRMPVLVRGQTVGSVTTLRDQTELRLLRNATETLRAQAHEFTNRLHTISGLIQLGHYEEAVNFIMQAKHSRESLSHEVQSRIADPALAALIVAKSSVAAEKRVSLRLDPSTELTEPIDEHLSSDLVTVAGNLIDNAVEAVESGGWVQLRIDRDDGAVRVTVCDSGQGVDSDVAEKVFHSGFTTKGGDGQRGLGLALVRQICLARGGDVEVEGATFTATLGVGR